MFGIKEKNRSENQEIIGELTSFILAAAQQRVLTEVQKAGEKQQQAGGSGVHPE